MHAAIAGLDHRGIRILARLVLQRHYVCPVRAVAGGGDAERGAPAGSVVENDQCASVFQDDGVHAGAGIGQRGGAHGRKSLAAVARPALGDFALAAAAEQLDALGRPRENRWLNRAEFPSIVQGRRARPGRAEVAGEFQMHAPAVMLAARAAPERVADQHGFGAHGAENVFRQTPGLRPRLPRVLRLHQHAPPLRGVGADLVEEQERALG